MVVMADTLSASRVCRASAGQCTTVHL